MLYHVRQNPNPYSCNKIVSCKINHTFFLTNAFSLSFCFIMPKSQNHKQISSQTISANRACPLTVVMCQSKTNQNKTNNIHTNKLKLSRPQTIVCFVIMLLLLIPTKNTIRHVVADQLERISPPPKPTINQSIGPLLNQTKCFILCC